MEVISTDRFFFIEFSESDSSYILSVEYDMQLRLFEISFKYGKSIVYRDVDKVTFNEFCVAPSKGKYYNSFIKSHFKTITMAKRSYVPIAVKVDVTQVVKGWFFKSENASKKDGHLPIYMDLKVMYSEEPDQHGGNGFVVQVIPKAIAKANPNLQAPILGNVKNLQDLAREDLAPAGQEVGKPMGADEDDDLPF